jgi:Tfp pilus assembly protein FimT
VTKRRSQTVSEAGVSLIELIFVLGIMGVVTGMAVVQISTSRPAALGDGGMRVVLGQMNAAREAAITQRRNMRVTFTNNNKVEIIREEPAGVTPSTTTIASVLMEGGLRFTTVTNVGDTPDLFCGGSITAVSFPTATGTPPEVKFKPDGSFVNQAGAIVNGTVFVALPNQIAVAGGSNGVMSARAVTVLGSTGRVRGYRFDGRSWKPV